MASSKAVLGSIVPTFNSCIKCMGSRAYYTTARLIAIQFPGHGCIDDFTTEHCFDSQATWVIDVFAYLAWVFVQPGIARRPVDWCKNSMSALYMKQESRSSPKDKHAHICF